VSRRGIVLFLVLLGACDPEPAPPGEFGRFIGTVRTEWGETDREMTLLEDFAYVDPAGVRWDAPKGSKIDGASIPRFLWTPVGSPYTGAYRKASVTHDVACQKRDKTSDAVHLMFYNACRCGGCGEIEAKTLYAGVLLGGPRWGSGGITIAAARVRPVEEEFADVKAFIEANNPSIEEIRTFRPPPPTRPIHPFPLTRPIHPLPLTRPR
jgi:hypothetical protein